jgi:ribosomal protein S18 acetylase RimI-like enzyme
MNAIANEARIAAGDEFYTTVDEMRFYYEHLETCDLAQDLFLAELDGALAGYARAAWHDEADLRAYEPIVFVDPTLDHEALYPALLDVALERIDQIAGGHPPGPKVARVEVTDASTRLEATVRQRGFLPVRTFYTMVRPTLDDLADAPLPDGIEIRDVRTEHLEAIYDAEVEAFRGHWGEAEPTDASRMQWFRTPGELDTSLWRVGWDGDRVAGSVRSFINAAQNERLGRARGWVEHISVGRPWRGRGLARALIAASLPLLRERGMTEGALGVDTDNEFGALRLYERCGFRPVSTVRAFSRTLE